MAKTRDNSAANIASYSTQHGRRARRPEGAFRRFFDDRAIGFGPSQPGAGQRVAQKIVASPTLPADAPSLKAPDQQEGWIWEEPQTAAPQPATVEPKSFEQRFPSTHVQATTEIQAEAPSPYADAYMDANGSVDAAPVEAPESTQRAPVAETTVLNLDEPQQASSDRLLHAERTTAYQHTASIPDTDENLAEGNHSHQDAHWHDSEYVAVEEAQESVHWIDPAFEESTISPEEQHVAGSAPASALETNVSASATHKADNRQTPQIATPTARPSPQIGQTMSAIWSGSRRTVGSVTDALLASAGLISKQSMPLAKRIGSTTRAAGDSLASAVTKPFHGASMKRQELPDNSLLELDEGHKVHVDQDGQEPLSGHEAKQLKKQKSNTSAAVEPTTADQEAHGVVGAVQLAPNSPLPRDARSNSAVTNPVTHGTTVADETDYKISVTHAAPSGSEGKGPIWARIQRTNAVGLVFNGLLIFLGIIIAIIIGSLAWGVFTGNTPQRTEPLETASALEPVSTATPTVSEPVAPPVSAAVDLSVGEVMELEGFLAQLSLDTGPVDGFADDATRAAVQEFEKILALPSTDGTLTKNLQGEIRGFIADTFGF